MFKESYKRAIPSILAATAVGIGVTACGSAQPKVEYPVVTTTTYPNANGAGNSLGSYPESNTGNSTANANGPGNNTGTTPESNLGSNTPSTSGNGGQEVATPNINYTDPVNIVSALKCSISDVRNFVSPMGNYEVSMNINITDTSDGRFVLPSTNQVSNPEIFYGEYSYFDSQELWKYSQILPSFTPVESVTIAIPDVVNQSGSIVTIYDNQQTPTNGNNTPCGAIKNTWSGWAVDTSINLPGSQWGSNNSPVTSSNGASY